MDLTYYTKSLDRDSLALTLRRGGWAPGDIDNILHAVKTYPRIVQLLEDHDAALRSFRAGFEGGRTDWTLIHRAEQETPALLAELRARHPSPSRRA